MLSPFLLSSTLLRTQGLRLPPTFRRYKSLTAAIERGRQDGPDRPRRPRTQTPPERAGDGSTRTRRELRFERFGPSKDGRDESDTRNGPRRDSGSRSSRFGRVGPPRSRDHAPSRFREDREERPSRTRDGPPRHQQDSFGRSRERTGFNGDRKPPSDRFGGRERSGYRTEDVKPRRERYDQRSDGESQGGRPSNRGKRVTAPGYQYPARGTESANQGGYGGRPERSERPFRGRDESSSFPRKPHGKEQEGRYAVRDTRQSRTTRHTETPKSSVREPESFPYTTAASEFIYGHSSVLAAIKANRRKIYNLYVHSRGANRDGLLARIRALKLFHITQEVGDEYLRAMDKASSGRPHNGVILETSPLPVPPITELKPASLEHEMFSVGVDSQSAEDAIVNGTQELYSYKSAGWRHPLVLYVDGVVDEGNLGAIARSAYFLGVDAIATPTRQSAPWSHIALKASAGAAEALPIFKIGEPTDFLGKSSRAGWRIYASDAIPPPPPAISDVQDDPSSNIVYTFARSSKRLPVDHCPVADHPTILMMGSEGTGLRDSLLNLAHYKVGIRHGREVDEVGIDSLNVSAAASLLCYEMLQKPIAKPAVKPEEVLF